MNQAQRYKELAARTEGKTLDSSYHAAFYLLSCEHAPLLFCGFVKTYIPCSSEKTSPGSRDSSPSKYTDIRLQICAGIWTAVLSRAVSYNTIKENIRVEVVNRDMNKESLKNCPKKEIEGTDLLAVFHGCCWAGYKNWTGWLLRWTAKAPDTT